MAEDKKIRVSADLTPLQELRQGAQALLDDINNMEGRFRALSGKTLDTIQAQIDLLKERNKVADEFNPGKPILYPLTPGQAFRPTKGDINPNQVDSGKVVDAINKIAEILETEFRNRQNGILPNNQPIPPQPGNDNDNPLPPPPPPEHDKVGNGRFSIPTSVSGLLGKMGMAGMIAAAVGIIAGKVANAIAQQYTAENKYQRENQRWGWIPFVGSAIEQVKEADRQAGQRFEEAGSQRARMLGTTYHNAGRRAVMDAGGDVNFDNVWEERTISHQNTDGTTTFRTAYVNKYTGEERQSKPNLGNEGYNENWYGKSLGLSMSQFTQRQNELSMAAGGRPMQSTDYRTEQLMLAEQIRGIPKSLTEDLQKTVRFGSDQLYQAGTAGAVIRTFDVTLQRMGKTNSEIVGTLQEYLGQFNRTSTQVLERTETVNTAGVTQAIATLRTRGFEGRQLERVTNSLTGLNVSQDDVTQALLLRTARELNPNGSLSDLLADIDEMGDLRNGVAPKFFDKIKEMTGSNEMLRFAMKAAYPELTFSDIRKLTSGKNENATGEQLLQGVKMVLEGYTRARAETTVGTQTKDTADEATRKEIEGLRKVEDAAGNPLSKEDKGVPPLLERPDMNSILILNATEEQTDILRQLLFEVRKGVEIVPPYRP